MSDQSGQPTAEGVPIATPDPAPAEEQSPKEIAGIPIAMFMKEGTSTYASDMLDKQKFADAEKRRDVAALEKEIVQREKGVEGSMASMHTSRLTENQDVPAGYVELLVCNQQGTQMDGPDGRPAAVICDVTMGTDPRYPDELVLVIVCPHCVYDLGVHQDDAQIRIGQRHRAWHLDQRAVNCDPIVCNIYDDNARDLVLKTLPRMGMVTDSDRIPCPRCSRVYRIDKNRLWPQ